MADAEKTLYDEVIGLAEKLTFASDEKKEAWINEHMRAAGWKPNTTWTPPDGKDGKKDGDSGSWFK